MARDNADAGKELWEETKDYARKHGMELHPALDVMFFVSTLGWFFG